jgi:uncharacterized membrane protein
MTLPKFLAAAAIAWLVFLAAGWWSGAHHGPAWLTSVVYLSAGRVCHQLPERSFVTLGVKWPVCGRCAGLYLAAPIGALAALAWWKRQSPAAAWLVGAAAPTAATIAIEWAGLAPMSSLTRFLAAVPLGAAVGFYLVTVSGSRRTIG